ncbi:sine oculis-binding protein homolog B-like isoform X1 [Saccostrea echinata]|uniref:sine oculis-binding protein homolog B-like isoform X1 n=1 Tax=Saccostrea echinata TaxID=191078 RepID=UPI002A8166D1|nr:sine oculis-binding protein homolog B-like isoform X1 [Saccostrea echinata]
MEDSKGGRLSSTEETSDDRDDDVSTADEPNSEMKDYAESTMNELLGLYGFEKFDRTETEHLNVDRFTSPRADDRLSPPDDASRDDVSVDSCDSSSGRSDLSKYNRSRSNSETNLAAQHRNLVTALTKKHGLTGAPEGTIPSGSIVCAWCQKLGVKLFTLKTSTSTKAFCSELCFDQCRRASFKKNKICDWCKHVRHTVNYVDFQDGETQLQFCSSKCLNQYKMNIFCKETQEHLQQISPTEGKSDTECMSDQQILITPELWLSNAKQSAKNRRKDTGANSEDPEKSSQHLPQRPDSKTDQSRRQSPLSVSSSSDKLPVTNRSILERMHSRDKSKRSSLKDSYHERSVPRSKSPDSVQSTQSLGMPLVPPPIWAPAFGMGIPPMGAVPPWFYPGFMPPGFMPPSMPMDGLAVLPTRTATPTASNSKRFSVSPNYESESSKTANEDRSRASSRQVASVRSNTPRASTPRNATFSTPTPPNAASLPNHVGMYGQNGMNPTACGSIPPLTMILPVPVPLPLPVPIPLPLPITMEKIMEVYNKTKEDTPLKVNIKTEPEFETERKDFPRFKGDVNENETISKDMLSCASCSSDRSESVNSCVSPMSDVRYASQSDLLKRPFSPNMEGSLDLSKRARLEDSFSDQSCDGAIDLSNTSQNRHRLYKGKENKDNVESENSSAQGSESNNKSGDSGLKIPKIHIISPRHDPPLSQQLPLPPVDPKYASRRGLILDAPRVPKKPRSPSPDRRSYARSVPKDVMEAARRRCMRARIKTK